MNVSNTLVHTKVLARELIKRKILLTFASLFLFSIAAIHTQHALAETNVSGVDIEVIEPVDTDLVVDPVQDFLSDGEANDGNQNDLQADLWSRIKDGYAMPNIESQYTTNHETWYAARPDYVKRMMERSQKYLFHIVEEVQKRGMPTEIALLPMIESAFNPQANSRSAAAGIWQFIPSTGKNFGLKQNWWVDNRRDVTAGTNAALNYLQKLHGMFGTWDLALAAYNAGEGTVQRAIDRNRKQGLPTDYQSLSLPAETKNYVPKLQAIKNIVTDPEKFGLKINSIPNKPYFTRVTSPKQIDAKLAAQLAEISFDEFSSLNPSYNRPVITSNGEVHQLLLPTWAAERFSNNLANYDKPLTSWQTYNGKRGERMDNIAQKFGINVSQLRNVNGLSNSNKLHSAQAMLVPVAFKTTSENNATNNTVASEASDNQANNIDVAEMENNNAINQSNDNQSRNEPKSSRPVLIKVKRGDTLQGLADKYDTNAKSLIKINHLRNGKIVAGQTIKVTEYSSSKLTKNTRVSGRYKSSGHARSSKFIVSSKSNRVKNNHSKSSHISARTHIRLK